MKDAVEKIAMGFIGLAVVVTLVNSRNSSTFANSVFSGTGNLFGTIMKPVGGGGFGGIQAPTVTVNG